MSPVWQIVTAPPLLWRAWDDEIVVYNEASGETHRLDPLPAEAFEMLLEGPLTSDALSERMAQALEVPKTAEFSESIAAILQLFHDHSLIEPVQPS
jgi:PqqD family protein of HPr-rel-A system